ncbi:CLUMA_CG009297, isoform A [Clunio marinus]|uniref:CLUMA_CG009297, isoform A n=1 Tax=Clunio marinus TaxID=568069 RepID=A0A1J1I7Y6_9DIPT|nr:CLUMA_CG009297, isoform A [Clunio marinus]
MICSWQTFQILRKYLTNNRLNGIWNLLLNPRDLDFNTGLKNICKDQGRSWRACHCRYFVTSSRSSHEKSCHEDIDQKRGEKKATCNKSVFLLSVFRLVSV